MRTRREHAADVLALRPASAGLGSIGQAVNIYSDNVLSILEQFAQGERGQRGHAGRDPIDVLLVGGDLIDHVKNVFPYGWKSEESLRAGNVNAAKIWEVVGLDDDENKERNYQPFVDHLSFYSIIKYFCETHQKAVFVVSGNHDAYEDPYGISPGATRTPPSSRRSGSIRTSSSGSTRCSRRSRTSPSSSRSSGSWGSRHGHRTGKRRRRPLVGGVLRVAGASRAVSARMRQLIDHASRAMSGPAARRRPATPQSQPSR